MEDTTDGHQFFLSLEKLELWRLNGLTYKFTDPLSAQATETYHHEKMMVFFLKKLRLVIRHVRFLFFFTALDWI